MHKSYISLRNIIEQSIEWKVQRCIGFTYFKNAFDSIHHIMYGKYLWITTEDCRSYQHSIAEF